MLYHPQQQVSTLESYRDNKEALAAVAAVAAAAVSHQEIINVLHGHLYITDIHQLIALMQDMDQLEDTMISRDSNSMDQNSTMMAIRWYEASVIGVYMGVVQLQQVVWQVRRYQLEKYGYLGQ